MTLIEFYKVLIDKKLLSHEDLRTVMKIHIKLFNSSVKNRSATSQHTNGNSHKKELFISSLLELEKMESFFLYSVTGISTGEVERDFEPEDQLKSFIYHFWPKLTNRKMKRKDIISRYNFDPYVIISNISAEEIQHIQFYGRFKCSSLLFQREQEKDTWQNLDNIGDRNNRDISIDDSSSQSHQSIGELNEEFPPLQYVQPRHASDSFDIYYFRMPKTSMTQI
jgi:hypothetical protein